MKVDPVGGGKKPGGVRTNKKGIERRRIDSAIKRGFNPPAIAKDSDDARQFAMTIRRQDQRERTFLAPKPTLKVPTKKTVDAPMMPNRIQPSLAQKKAAFVAKNRKT